VTLVPDTNKATMHRLFGLATRVPSSLLFSLVVVFLGCSTYASASSQDSQAGTATAHRLILTDKRALDALDGA
ncbi:hypothetical protein AAVH_30303, partial [Aphelenchoides avenae]